jgi:F-type H+-transporting ATPase subunit gamma
MKAREVKNKITSIKNFNDITYALQLISVIKMKRAQKMVLDTKPFVKVVLEIIEELVYHQDKIKETIYFKKEKGKTLAVVISSDKGFCGSFNRNILNFAQREIEKMGGAEIFAVGKKAINFFEKRNFKILEKITGIGDFGEIDETKPIADKLIGYFTEGRYQKILLFYTHFLSPFLQRATKVQILPLDSQLIEQLSKEYKKERKNSYFVLLEPSPKEIFENLVPQLVRYLVHYSILQANASEHSARMLAMKRATDNTKEIIENLTLKYNKFRQNEITNEVCEITSAKEAIK